MVKLAYDIAVRLNAPFDKVVEALRTVEEASNIYWEIIDRGGARVAVFVGEKYFFRAKNSLALTTIVIEQPEYTILRLIATGSRESLFDFIDLRATKDYATETIEKITEKLGTKPILIAEAHHLKHKKARILHSM